MLYLLRAFKWLCSFFHGLVLVQMPFIVATTPRKRLSNHCSQVFFWGLISRQHTHAQRNNAPTRLLVVSASDPKLTLPLFPPPHPTSQAINAHAGGRDDRHVTGPRGKLEARARSTSATMQERQQQHQQGGAGSRGHSAEGVASSPKRRRCRTAALPTSFFSSTTRRRRGDGGERQPHQEVQDGAVGRRGASISSTSTRKGMGASLGRGLLTRKGCVQCVVFS